MLDSLCEILDFCSDLCEGGAQLTRSDVRRGDVEKWRWKFEVFLQSLLTFMFDGRGNRKPEALTKVSRSALLQLEHGIGDKSGLDIAISLATDEVLRNPQI